MRNFVVRTGCLLVVVLLVSRIAAAQTPCEQLTSLVLPHTTIATAEMIPAGPYKGPGPGQSTPVFILPAHCRVAAVLAPSSDSHIEMELWLPTEWNGKFQAIGNGGWAGAISFAPGANNTTRQGMTIALQDGYATASTDTGHRAAETPGGSFALGHPEKLVDFAYRAVHEMTVQSKAIINAYYARMPRYSYWNGCSTGGRQGLLEAQRYPEDYDGIVAGAPANNWVRLTTQFIWIAQAAHKDGASYIPPAKYPAIHEAVLQACDGLDGVKDRVLNNPLACKFDPKVLECKGKDSESCLTPAQVELASKIYAPATNPRTKEPIHPGLMPGSEVNWASQAGPTVQGISNDYYRFVVFKNPDWDYKMLNFDSDVALAEITDGGLITATNPDLRAFFARGGKLLQYHGWSDQLISALDSIEYYKSVVQLFGAPKVHDSYRLFMVPGMLHCGGGAGANHFNPIAAIERWRESGVAPDQLYAVHVTDNRVDTTRPLCPYPQVPTYKGTGSTSDGGNFACKAP